MTFQPHVHQQAPFYTANGMVYEDMTSIPSGPTPDSVRVQQFTPQGMRASQGQDFDYRTSQAPIQHPGGAPYGLSTHYAPATPANSLDMSPVEHVQIEFTDLSAPYPEDLNYKPRKQDGGRQPSTSMHMRRRAQNRASQRAFRERKEKHTQDLQRRLTEVEQQYEQLKHNYDVVHKEKCQLEAASRRCSCGGSIVTSPGSVGDLSQASDCGDLPGERSIDVGENPRRRAVSMNFNLAEDPDGVYEVVDWGVAGH